MDDKCLSCGSDDVMVRTTIVRVCRKCRFECIDESSNIRADEFNAAIKKCELGVLSHHVNRDHQSGGK